MLSRQSAAAVKNIFWCFLNQTSWFNLFFLENLFPSYVHLTQFMHLSGIYQAQTSSEPHLLKGEQLLWCHGVSSCNIPPRKEDQSLAGCQHTCHIWAQQLQYPGKSWQALPCEAPCEGNGGLCEAPCQEMRDLASPEYAINTPRQQRELHPVG